MITLNNKDADFIANNVRDMINHFYKCYENAKEDINRGRNKAKELLEFLELSNDNDAVNEYNKYLKKTEESAQKLEKDFHSDIEKWQKVLELVMIGSN